MAPNSGIKMAAFKFDELPPACLKRIFEFLRLQDLVKCRKVNRLFKLYADKTEVNELVVGTEWTNFGDNWYLTNREIDFVSAIQRNVFSLVRSSPFKLDQRLKILHIQLEKTLGLDFELLNSLKQLVHLEIKSEAINDNPKIERGEPILPLVRKGRQFVEII